MIKIPINIILILTIVILFIVTIMLVVSISNNRSAYLGEIDAFKNKLNEIRELINTENNDINMYKESNKKMYNQIIELEQSYDKMYREKESILQVECEVELQKQKQKNQKDMEQFSKDKELVEYIANLIYEKIKKEMSHVQ